MKAYVIVTGVLFAVVLAVHVARLFAEGWHVLLNPFWDILNALVLGMLVWSVFVLRQWPSRNPEKL